MGKRNHNDSDVTEGKKPNPTAQVRFDDGQRAAVSRPELVRYADGKIVPGAPSQEQARAASVEMSGTEKWTRFGFTVAHGIGGGIATVFGAGALVPVLGELENRGLDAAFKRDTSV